MQTVRQSRLTDLFERQHGVIHRRQAVGAGLSVDAIQRRIKRGDWLIVLPGTYRLSGAPVTWHQRVMAAVLWAGPGAVASHRTAAALWALPGFPPAAIEVTTNRRLSAPGIVVHRGRLDARIDVSTHSGIPVTSPHRTIIDLCAVTRPVKVERALDAVMVRGLGEVSFIWRQLNRLGSVGRRGCAQLRSMLAERSERLHHAASDSETALHQLLRKAGIGGWAPQVEIFDADDFVARPDVVFHDLRIVIEVDSWSWHADKKRRREDVRRQNWLEHLGWTVLRFFWEDVMHDPAYVLSEIRKALHSRRLESPPLEIRLR